MPDYSVLVPTGLGPVGAIVSVPERDPVAAAVLYQGWSSHRFGNNQVWAETARALAHAGVVVCRADYPGFGESGAAQPDFAALRTSMLDALVWFRQGVPGLDLLAIGSCFGGRLALEVAAADDSVVGLGLVCPAFEPMPSIGAQQRPGCAQSADPDAPPPREFDPAAVELLARVVTTARGWVLVGDHDVRSGHGDAAVRAAELGLDGEVAPGVSLHGMKDEPAQVETRVRVTAWASRTLAERTRTATTAS